MPRFNHNIVLAILLSVLLIDVYPARAQQDLSDGNWSTLASSQVARAEAAGVVYKGKLYAFGGRDSGLRATPSSEAYDASTDSWNTLAPIPRAVRSAGVQVVDGSVWLVGGFEGDYPGTAVNIVQIYDVAQDTWHTGPPLPVRRGSGSLALLGRKLHFIGGLLPDGQTDVSDHYVLDVDHPQDGWSSAAPLPSRRSYAGTTVTRGKIYIIGGEWEFDGKRAYSRLVHVYDGATDTWSSVARLPEGRSHFGGGTFVHNSRIIVAGGRRSSSSSDQILAYDVDRDLWSEIGRLPARMHSFEAGMVGDRMIAANGMAGPADEVLASAFSIALEPSEPDTLGFWPPLHDMHLMEGNSLRADALLWTGRNEVSFSLDPTDLPDWLSITSDPSGTVLPTGTRLGLRADASELPPGTYRSTLTVSAPPYTPAAIDVFLTVTPKSTDIFVEEDGLVVVEAENFQEKQAGILHDWTINSLYESSGAAVVAAPDEGANWETDLTSSAPELRYRIRFSTPGTYYVWVRGWGPNGNADSWHVGIDGAPVQTADRMTLLKHRSWPPLWLWSNSTMDGPRARLEISSPGVRLVSIWMREDGTFLDRLLLTTDPDYVPDAVGDEESRRISSAETPTSRGRDPENPATFALEPNYPNPFNPSTTIRFSVPETGHVRLAIYDLLGREVSLLVNETVIAGGYEVKFESGDLPSGMYLYELRAGGSTQVRPMMLVR